MLRLAAVDRYNFLPLIQLSVAEEQTAFVASNVYSLAQAHVQPECIPLALYDGDTPVGFAMYGVETDDHEYWIYRLMIDKRFQRRGYGRVAMLLLLERIRSDPDHNRVYISFEPQNDAARLLYESLGFVSDGRLEYGEIVYRFDY